MLKIRKNMITEYNKTLDIVKKSKLNHKMNVDKIIDIMEPYVAEKYKNDRVNWSIQNIEFCNDHNMKGIKTEWEWVEISEDKYYKLRKEENMYYNRNQKTKLKEEYIFEPEFKDVYYQEVEKKYKYLRVYVHESWGYGGSDDLSYDFLMTDIMDERDLRKEKLKKLEEII